MKSTKSFSDRALFTSHMSQEKESSEQRSSYLWAVSTLWAVSKPWCLR